MLELFAARNTIALASHAALEEIGVDHRLHWVNFAEGEQTGAAYLAVNPKGRVPALVTPHGVLTETIAILEWLAATHPQAGLMPADPWQAARVREVMTYLASTMHVNHAHKKRGSRWADDPAAHDAMRAKVPETMTASARFLEDRLEGDWIAGAFGVADLYLWPLLRWMDGDGVPLAGFPKLQALHDRVAARPGPARALAMHLD